MVTKAEAEASTVPVDFYLVLFSFVSLLVCLCVFDWGGYGQVLSVCCALSFHLSADGNDAVVLLMFCGNCVCVQKHIHKVVKYQTVHNCMYLISQVRLTLLGMDVRRVSYARQLTVESL